MAYIDPAADYEKPDHKVPLNALRGRISVLYFADEEYGPYEAVGVNLRLVVVCGDLLWGFGGKIRF
jgi:hypothetical protein